MKRNDGQTAHISNMFEICGFIPITDIGSPVSMGRHLMLQINPNKDNSFPSLSNANVSKQKSDNTENPELTIDDIDDRNVPSFCVLLHGSLKFENMAALVVLAPNWYGFIYPFADNKKKSNLMLSILQPGTTSVPWLGNLLNISLTDSNSASTENEAMSLPIKSNEKKSYSQNFVTWTQDSSLESDVQKVLRHARKLPEKTLQFYKVCSRNKIITFLK